MNRTRKAVATLTLGLALAAVTTTAWATPPDGAGSPADQRKALYQSELQQNLRHGKAADEAVAALSTQRAALYQAELDRNLAAAPASPASPAAPAAGVDVLATLLLALFGGLLGGAAATVAWIASRRRSPRAVAGA